MKFSVVVAAWNEGAQIGSALKRLRHISQDSPMEIIVVDGGSDDDTAAQARDWADTVLVLDAPNRGAQFDAGAKKATGDLLFFLRADSQPPAAWQSALEHFWLSRRSEGTSATCFSVDYGSTWAFRAASMLSNVRARVGHAGGDHGLCTTPEHYRRAGGFPDFAYMEDEAFCARLLKQGRIVLLPERIWPAARRMHQIGALRAELGKCWLGLRYRLGASPDSLFRSYHGR